MREKLIKYAILAITGLAFVCCTNIKNNRSEQLKITDGFYKLLINKTNLKFCFTDENGNTVVPSDSISGLFMNDSPVVSTEIQSISANRIVLNAITKEGEAVRVEIAI